MTTKLRRQMDNAMVLRGFSPRTRECYLACVTALARYYGRSPDGLDIGQIQDYLLYLIREKKLAYASVNQAVCAVRFLFDAVLGHKQLAVEVPMAKVPKRLPQILSCEQVNQLFAAAASLRARTVLMTAYAAGLRVAELCALQVQDIESAPDRMCIKVRQGKGQRDRYTLLSPRLLEQLRCYWHDRRPRTWLFPNRAGTAPIGIVTAQRIYYAARDAASIPADGGIHSLRHYAECRVMPSVHSGGLGHRGGSRTPRPDRFGIIRGYSGRPAIGRRDDIGRVAPATGRSARVPSLSMPGRHPDTSGSFRLTRVQATVR